MPMRSTCLIIPLCSCTHRAVHQPEICPIFPHGQTQRPNRRMCLEFGTLSILCLSSASETIRIQRPAVSRSTTALTDTLHAKRRHKAHPVDMAFFFLNPLPLSILLVSFSSSLSLTIPLWSQSVKSEVHVHNKKVTGQSCTLSLSLTTVHECHCGVQNTFRLQQVLCCRGRSSQKWKLCHHFLLMSFQISFIFPRKHKRWCLAERLSCSFTYIKSGWRIILQSVKKDNEYKT